MSAPERSASAVAEVGQLADLKPDPRNPRRHTERNRAAVQTSLQEVGFVRSLAAAADGTLIAGNLTAEALAELGMDDVIIVRSDGTRPIVHIREDIAPGSDAALLAGLYDNRAAELADGYDPAVLAAILAQVRPAATLLTPEEALALIGPRPGGGPDADDVPDPPAVAVTQPGDLWRLGEHRLVCGDSRLPADVGRVLGGERAGLLHTDPPYLVGYTGGGHPGKGGAEQGRTDWSDRYGTRWDESGADFSLWEGALTVARDVALTAAAAWYVWHPDRHVCELRGIFAHLDILVHQLILWVKDRPVLSHTWYQQAHEPCLFGWPRGHKPVRHGVTQHTTVWRVDHDPDKVAHPTQKPVELFSRPLLIHTIPGDLVYEPFCGSGSQLIAAELAGRRCAALEIEPLFCDVIVERWQQFTGGSAQRVAG